MRSILSPIFVSISAAPALLAGAAYAQSSVDTDRYIYGPHMMWWGGGWFPMLLGPLFMVLFLAVLIAAVVLLVRWLGHPGPGLGLPPSPPMRTPLDILKERFARGEIDKEEFEERRRLLGD